MNKELRVKVFCLNSDLCNLLRKYFHKSNFICLCIKLGIDSFGLSDDITDIDDTDCIIIDDTISTEYKKLITEKYKDTTVLHIPALLEVNEDTEKDKTVISEPFKISELDRNLKELYDKKFQN
jgi:hypothetical protein